MFSGTSTQCRSTYPQGHQSTLLLRLVITTRRWKVRIWFVVAAAALKTLSWDRSTRLPGSPTGFLLWLSIFLEFLLDTLVTMLF